MFMYFGLKNLENIVLCLFCVNICIIHIEKKKKNDILVKLFGQMKIDIIWFEWFEIFLEIFYLCILKFFLHQEVIFLTYNCETRNKPIMI